MSGTSLDGLDVVSAEFDLSNGIWNYKILHGHTFPYDPVLLKEVREVMGKKPEFPLDDLDLRLGRWMANCVNDFVKKNKCNPDFVASHGQTVFHDPANGITIQLGNGLDMANRTGLTVVNDFRSQDVKLGGQGAPLVPMGDLLLFREYVYCLNLGGIANISVKENRGIKAFDVCVCNVGANFFSNMLGQPYDKNGETGATGKIKRELLKNWNDLPYFRSLPPKSLDAGYFKSDMQPLISRINNLEVNDLLRTWYEHVALQISKQVVQKDKQILTTGGGANNRFLTELMKTEYGLNLVLPGSDVVEFKEALIFGFLGLLKVRDEINVWSSVTGAEHDHCSGTIHFPVF